MENSKKQKDKAITVRIPIKLYDFFLEKTLERTQKERRVVKISEIIREAIENGK